MRPRRTSSARHLCGVSITACAALLLSGVAAIAPASASTDRTESTTAVTHKCRTGADDFDGNGGTDLAASATYTGGDEDEDYVPPGQVVVEMRTKSGYRTVHINPPKVPVGHVADFGRSIAELDISPHTKASEPCADLAIGAGVFKSTGDDSDKFVKGVVFLYRYERSHGGFVLLHTITGIDIDPSLTGFGRALAAQTMRTDRPQPRRPVLYVGAQSEDGQYKHGAVVRLTLRPSGAVLHQQVIAPGKTATGSVPLTYSSARDFGATLTGTPSADQVIIGDDEAYRGAGAVVVWNRSARSQLLTQKMLGKPATSAIDAFGRAIWLSTEEANASGGPTYLFIGAPGRTVQGNERAGAAFQLRYDRNGQPARVVSSSGKFWSQASKGVDGGPEPGDGFGASFESLSRGKTPRFIVGVPYEEHANQIGAVDVLGTGRVYYDRTLGHRPYASEYSESELGTSMGGWRNVDDYLDHDAWPAPGKGKWSRNVVVGEPIANVVVSGLPAGDITTVKTITSDGCSYEDGSCGFGKFVTASGGG